MLAFALLMEERLREKDADKGQSWKLRVLDDLNVRAIEKMTRLDSAISNRKEATAAAQAVDLANYSMMIADVAGALVPEAGSAA